MIFANLKNGSTSSFDIFSQNDFDQLSELLSTGNITALSLHHNKIHHILPLPKRFKTKPIFGFDCIFDLSHKPVGELIFVQADNVRVNLTLTYKNSLIRCDLVKTGLMRYNHRERKVRK